jgi:acetylornithine deacetylase/succinyl-diaminopimelate desuccinylase-like protein
VVAVEGHGLEAIVVDAVGSVRCCVAVDVPGGHSWLDRGSLNAIHEILAIAGRLLSCATPDEPVNIGLISGGMGVNAIAQHAELLVEQRALDPARLDAFEHHLADLSRQTNASVEVRLLGRRPAGRLARDVPLLLRARAIRKELGLEDALIAGSTDANAAIGLGIPAISVGVARGHGMHSIHESIEVSSLDPWMRTTRATRARSTRGEPSA